MSGGWEVGDLALCVKAVAPIKKGQINTVVFAGPDKHTGEIALAFEGVKPSHPKADSFLANRFRKISPHTPDAEDRETISLLNKQPDEVPA